MSAILGPETAAPILWTPGKMRSFCRKTYVHKIPRLGGGGVFWVWGGGGEVPILFLWARGYPKDPAVLKILRVVNLLRVVFLVRRGDLLSRRALCGHHFPGN